MFDNELREVMSCYKYTILWTAAMSTLTFLVVIFK